MKNSIVIFCLLFIVCISHAQQMERSASANAKQIFVEVLGSGVYYSVNYDQRFNKTENGLGIRAGVCVGGSLFTFPVQLNYLAGSNGNYLELGAGITYASTKVEIIDGDRKSNNIIGNATIGYRRQPFTRRGITWRIAFTPFYGNIGNGFYPWVGASIGYRF